MTDLAAVNTWPLIYLANARLLELLQVVAPSIIVVSAVADEIEAGPADEAAHAIATIPWLQVVPSPPIPAAVLAWDLGPGESALLAFGLANPLVDLIIDDLAARRCAASLGLRYRGTLGLVVTAKKRGVIVSALMSSPGWSIPACISRSLW